MEAEKKLIKIGIWGSCTHCGFNSQLAIIIFKLFSFQANLTSMERYKTKPKILICHFKN